MEPDRSTETWALITRHRAGDPAALQALFTRYYPRVRDIVRARLGAGLRAHDGIDDVVQEVFVTVVDGIDGYEPRDGARWIDWAAVVAGNRIAMLARERGALKRGGPNVRHVPIASESGDGAVLAHDATSIGGQAARNELRERIIDCIAELPERYREVILLRDYADGSWNTDAELMGRTSAEACAELHRRARAALAAALQARL